MSALKLVGTYFAAPRKNPLPSRTYTRFARSREAIRTVAHPQIKLTSLIPRAFNSISFNRLIIGLFEWKILRHFYIVIGPFKEDESVDYEALARLVDYQLQNGTDYLVVLGTTAETPTLTEEEKKDIINLVVTKVNGRIPIVLGVGGNCTRSVVEKLKNDNFDGIDAILSVVPYYNKPSQEGIYQHYKAIAEATTLPIVLYNVPGRTGVNMTAETTLRIAREFKNVIAVKEASGNITQMDDIIKNKPANFNVISGDDGITFPLITLGAVGVISVIGACPP